MTVAVKQFGEYLTSRPAGREAFLAARAYGIPRELDKNENIKLDFSGVKVLTPSWIDEFMRGLEETYGSDRIEVLPSDNLSVTMSLQAIRET